MATTWETQNPASQEAGFLRTHFSHFSHFSHSTLFLPRPFAHCFEFAYNRRMQNKHNIIAAILTVLAILSIGAYFLARPSAPGTATTGTSTPITTTVSGVTITGGGATVTETPANAKVPDFRTPLTFSGSTSAEVRTALTKQFDATVKILEGDKLNFSAWINLGTLRKVTGDYTGAETVWKYAAGLYPKSTVPSDNLGSLYLDFLKNYPKAETYYKLSIGNDSHDINAYQQLISLYTVYGYPSAQAGKDKALALVEPGLKANPDNQTLLDLRTQLQAN